MRVSFREAIVVWLKIGLLSFGGPAGQIALMHRELVEKRKWIGETRYLHALNYCMLLPGPEATQLATYVGWLLHGLRGGLAAGILFVLPGAVVMLALSTIYSVFHDVTVIAGLFFGMKAAVLAIVTEALIRIGKRALKSRFHVGLAFVALLALALFAVPFPAVVVAAGLIGAVFARFGAELLGGRDPAASVSGAAPVGGAASAGAAAHAGAATPAPNSDRASKSSIEVAVDDNVIDAMAARGELAHTSPSVARFVRTVLTCATLWLLPVAIVVVVAGPDHIVAREGVFFSEAAAVTFGGAYAVLSFVGQHAVSTLHWLTPKEMLDGLALAETTPGPLILVLEFVGFVAAYKTGGIALALAGAVMTLWTTFVPALSPIFIGAPYIEALRGRRVLDGALAAITAAVVGVIANLSLFLAMHALFGVVEERNVGIVHVGVPDVTTLDVWMLGLTALAFALLFGAKQGLARTLAVCGVLGAIVTLLRR